MESLFTDSLIRIWTEDELVDLKSYVNIRLIKGNVNWNLQHHFVKSTICASHDVATPQVRHDCQYLILPHLSSTEDNHCLAFSLLLLE